MRVNSLFFLAFLAGAEAFSFPAGGASKTSSLQSSRTAFVTTALRATEQESTKTEDELALEQALQEEELAELARKKAEEVLAQKQEAEVKKEAAASAASVAVAADKNEVKAGTAESFKGGEVVKAKKAPVKSNPNALQADRIEFKVGVADEVRKTRNTHVPPAKSGSVMPGVIPKDAMWGKSL